VKLYFLRHGLADRGAWRGRDDSLRPLTEEGKARMAREAAVLSKIGLKLDLILSSPLTRARQTAEIVGRRLGLAERVKVDERLGPGFGVGALSEILKSHAEIQALMLVGHEPDFSETIGSLIGGGQVVCKKGALARVDLHQSAPPRGRLVWLIPPSLLAL
jgi:phosphohistidine phosphatase